MSATDGETTTTINIAPTFEEALSRLLSRRGGQTFKQICAVFYGDANEARDAAVKARLDGLVKAGELTMARGRYSLSESIE